MRSMAVCLVWGLMMGSGMGRFAPPQEEAAPFRRDRVPLDVETMTSLSRQLTMLVGLVERDRPEEERLVSQMLGLALALDPANRGAREWMDRLVAGGGSHGGVDLDEDGRQRVLNRIWNLQGWLVADEAGEDGRILGHCLTDVLGVLDPTHPRAEKEGMGKWDGWVPALVAFEDKVTEEVAMVDEGGPEEVAEGEGAVQDGERDEVILPLVGSPVLEWNAEERQWQVSNLTMKVAEVEGGEEKKRLPLFVGGHEDRREGVLRWDSVEKQAREILPLRGRSMGKGFAVEVKLDGKPVGVSANRADTLVATMLVHLDAMRAGRVPQALVLARVGSEGSLTVPPRLWEMLKGLGEQSEGYRVIVPKAAADLLTGLLVMDRSGELMKHEFLMADSFVELCQLVEAGGQMNQGNEDPEEIDRVLASSELSKDQQAALKGFGEIRKVSQGKSLGSFLSHPSTQARLKEVVVAMPHHASARLLAMQGSGNRPRFMPTGALAREIRDAVRSLQGLNLAGDLRELKEEDVERTHTRARAQLDPLLPLIDTRDRELHRRAVSTVDGLRALDRTFRQRDSERQAELQAKQRATAHLVYDTWVVLMEDLTRIAGDGDDEVLPRKREVKKEAP